jgi:hypothetical protein
MLSQGRACANIVKKELTQMEWSARLAQLDLTAQLHRRRTRLAPQASIRTAAKALALNAPPEDINLQQDRLLASPARPGHFRLQGQRIVKTRAPRATMLTSKNSAALFALQAHTLLLLRRLVTHATRAHFPLPDPRRACLRALLELTLKVSRASTVPKERTPLQVALRHASTALQEPTRRLLHRLLATIAALDSTSRRRGGLPAFRARRAQSRLRLGRQHAQTAHQERGSRAKGKARVLFALLANIRE